MSCFIVKGETVSALSDFLACLLNNGFNYFNFSAPESLYKELNDCHKRGYYQEQEIFNRLSALNQLAYCARYKEEYQVIPDEVYKPNPKHTPAEYAPIDLENVNGRWDVKVCPWHYEMMKRIDCYLYQCMEEKADATGLYKALCELQSVMAHWIVCHSPAYLLHHWGD